MSQHNQQAALTDNSVSRQEILDVATLARLGIDEATAESYADDISKILGLMQTLAGVDTDNVAPLANIHEACQDLRDDVAQYNIDRKLNQSVAPSVENGLYLVPQVIE